jgi:hypothetical protein
MVDNLRIKEKKRVGIFHLKSKLSECLSELQNNAKLFGNVHIIIDPFQYDNPLYIYIKKEGNIHILKFLFFLQESN